MYDIYFVCVCVCVNIERMVDVKHRVDG